MDKIKRRIREIRNPNLILRILFILSNFDPTLTGAIPTKMSVLADHT